MDVSDLVIIGGGASGFMTAITAAENGVKKIKILESSSKLLEKVRISGGGRCNVTNACWIPNELIDNYPRGGKKLLESLSRFATGDVLAWFKERGLELKIENDLRVFPVSDSSIDVVNCLKKNAIKSGVTINIKKSVRKITRKDSCYFKVYFTEQEFIFARKILIATGGHPSGYKLAASLGHTIIKPVPSLFTFTSRNKDLKQCAGVSLRNVRLKIIINQKILENYGDLLITHWGFSGPGILKLSAIAARDLYFSNYKCKLLIRWSELAYEDLLKKINDLRELKGKSNLINSRPLPNLTKRLWIFLLDKIGIDKEKRWSEISSSDKKNIIKVLLDDEYFISAKGPFGEEFVKSGGVTLEEVNFRTMESIICPGLYFSGEVLNVDGITGGFNFQHCWTSGWIAGNSIAQINSIK